MSEFDYGGDVRRGDEEIVELSSDEDDALPEPYEALPSCPICLNDILDPSEKAVTGCMHTFCRPCLTEWLRVKRLCPLCKRRITTYLTHIVDDATFTQVDVTPSPPPGHHAYHLHHHTHHYHYTHHRLRDDGGQRPYGDTAAAAAGGGGGTGDVRPLVDLRAGGIGGGGGGSGGSGRAAWRELVLSRPEETEDLLRQLHRVADRLGESEPEEVADGPYGVSRRRPRGSRFRPASGEAPGDRRAPLAAAVAGAPGPGNLTSTSSTSWSARRRRLQAQPSQSQQQQQQQQPQQQQPRPYFFRLQQRLAAAAAATAGGSRPAAVGAEVAWDGVAAAAAATATAAATFPPGAALTVLGGGPQPGAALDAQAASLSYRRRVYDMGLWAAGVTTAAGRRGSRWGPAAAAPAATAGGAGGGSTRAVVRREAVEPWVARELRALIGTSDFTLLRALVMGLVDVYGTERDWSAEGEAQRQQQQQLGGGGAVGAAAEGPVAALTPFLFERAAHFWHELRSFALSGLTLQAYDIAVSYGTAPRGPQPRHPEPAEAQQPAATAARTAQAAQPQQHPQPHPPQPPPQPHLHVCQTPLQPQSLSQPSSSRGAAAGEPHHQGQRPHRALRTLTAARGPLLGAPLALSARPAAAVAAAAVAAPARALHRTAVVATPTPAAAVASVPAAAGTGAGAGAVEVVDMTAVDSGSPPHAGEPYRPPTDGAGAQGPGKTPGEVPGAGQPAPQPASGERPDAATAAKRRRRRWDERPPDQAAGDAAHATAALAARVSPLPSPPPPPPQQQRVQVLDVGALAPRSAAGGPTYTFGAAPRRDPEGGRGDWRGGQERDRGQEEQEEEEEEGVRHHRRRGRGHDTGDPEGGGSRRASGGRRSRSRGRSASGRRRGHRSRIRIRSRSRSRGDEAREGRRSDGRVGRREGRTSRGRDRDRSRGQGMSGSTDWVRGRQQPPSPQLRVTERTAERTTNGVAQRQHEGRRSHRRRTREVEDGRDGGSEGDGRARARGGSGEELRDGGRRPLGAGSDGGVSSEFEERRLGGRGRSREGSDGGAGGYGADLDTGDRWQLELPPELQGGR